MAVKTTKKPLSIKLAGILAICYLLINLPLSAQVNLVSQANPLKPSDCIEIISGNKYRFFFDTNYNLTTSSCAAIYREAAFDPALIAYHGNIKDYTPQGKLLVDGNYRNGVLAGTCSVYYTNGNLWQNGAFENGRMVGKWMFYFPDGDPLYELEVVDTSLRLINLWDKNGQQLVKNGTGIALLPYFKQSSTVNETETHWGGEVKNGKLTGRWKEYRGGFFTGLEELYRSGKFSKGYKGRQSYNTISFLSLEQEMDFMYAESFSLSACQQRITAPYYPKGELTLYKELLNYIGSVDLEPAIDPVAVVSFKVSTDGSLSEFKSESKTGVESLLIKALEKAGRWEPATLQHLPVDQQFTYAFPVRYTARHKGTDFSQNPNRQTRQELRDRNKTFNPPSIYSNGKFY